jgi:glutathionylspermidine synthase
MNAAMNQTRGPTGAVERLNHGEKRPLPLEGLRARPSCHGSWPLLRAGVSLNEPVFATLRRRAVLDGCKWDPQVGDTSTLAAFPLLIQRNEWRQLAAWAERLTGETLAAEREILGQPRLLDKLGLPRAVRRVLREDAPLTPAAARVMRFDFHPTTEGWQLSEVNSDVPGGYTESSFFTAMIAEHFPGCQPTGNPAAAWTEAVAKGADSGVVALLAAPGYMEDQQIMAFLAARLRERGCAACLAQPTQLIWHQGLACLETTSGRKPIGAIVRFYQSEWLARLPARFGWKHFFRGGRTPVVNPGHAILSESKRFPLLWDKLVTSLPTWRALLPETRDPRQVAWRTDETWLLKSALSNTGDDVSIRALLKPQEWRGVRWAVRFQPGNWVAQRRFDSVPVETPLGLMHACVGVYTIDGCAAGAYARLAPRPLIDYAAVDAALLMEQGHD